MRTIFLWSSGRILTPLFNTDPSRYLLMNSIPHRCLAAFIIQLVEKENSSCARRSGCALASLTSHFIGGVFGDHIKTAKFQPTLPLKMATYRQERMAAQMRT
jgi:hypothetical protein